MKKLFVIFGKSGVGKDTILKALLERRDDIKPVIPYTTRPKREGEIEGVDYHFITDEEIEKFRKNGQVIEMRKYTVTGGDVWTYATINDDNFCLNNYNYCMVSTLEGYTEIRKYLGKDSVVPICLEIDDITRIQRSLNRESKQENPNVAEICRRFLADEEDFSEELLKDIPSGFRIKNKSINYTVDIIEKIIGPRVDSYIDDASFMYIDEAPFMSN